ncbi:MAG: alpha/beta fold hydrolase, partial [Pseudomonadota bacterium]
MAKAGEAKGRKSSDATGDGDKAAEGAAASANPFAGTPLEALVAANPAFNPALNPMADLAAANPMMNNPMMANPMMGNPMMCNPMAVMEALAATAPLGLPGDPGAAAMGPEDAQKLMGNMAALFEKGREAWETMAGGAAAPGAMPAGVGEAGPLQLDPFNASGAFAEWWRSLAEDPAGLAEKTLKFWSDQAEVWRRAAVKASGGEAEPVAEAGRDKRFKDEDWSKNAVFDALKQSYLLTSAFLMDAAKSGGDLSPKDRKKVEFFTRQFVEAISPSNYFATNPEVLRTTLESRGENLVRGLQHMLEDLRRGKGNLLIRQTDLEKFKVGENMAVTPGKVIYRNEIIELIQYEPKTPNVESRPILFVPPWINKFYILDLNDEKSMVKWLVEKGHTVFLISWVNPDESHQHLEFYHYIADGLFDAAARVLDETEADKLHIASYCVGGTLSATALAYLAQQPEHPLSDRIASATYFTLQTEFSDAGDLQLFIDEQQLASLDAMMAEGVLGADKMSNTFNMLRSADLIWGFVVNNYLLGKDPFPFDLLYWNSDSTRMPARVHRYYLGNFYQDDKLAK